MASDASATYELPKVPVPHRDFISYVQQDTEKDTRELVAPYNEYEAKLREGFAQLRDHAALQDPNVNAVPLFGVDNECLGIRSRLTDDQALNEKYVIPLDGKDRKASRAPAAVNSIQDFKKNFNLFSESSLAGLDWRNVVTAGSSVVTALLPVPAKYNASKKALREYYHQQLAPSSDVDLFMWGLDEAAALDKIKQIEWSVRNAILEEVTTVRTKNAITIVSRYPIRHVQIVLRLYKSVSEILTGFDVDCSCFAYDGEQVYGTPRGVAAFMTQTNTIDLSRRSPSYESRLSKYAHRGFEVYYPDLDRSKIDPTIFERSFTRTMGLARLLVLEQLPKPGDRENYLTQRREERGRPAANDNYWNRGNALPDNVKDQDPDDIAEWVYDDEISNYHSFTVPYGPKYHAKKIEKLLYTKDLLLNAEWNRNKDRTVDLHRHPCFVGPIESVIHDCCGSCPEPKTDDERELADEESKIYISGSLSFQKDDPGRQAIGSFNPLTNGDWTDMAYIGNTQELCQSICDGNLELVQEWCERHPSSLDCRDHTGRTPLHLAVQCSTPEIVNCLVDNGSRIVARLVDGMTSLHLAAARGSVEMVTTLLEKSEENEEKEAAKEDSKNSIKKGETQPELERFDSNEHGEDEDSDMDMADTDSDEDTRMTEGSFVKIGDRKASGEDVLDGAEDSELDVYNVDVVAWDTPVSPLHLAILGGHVNVIKTLSSNFGADVLLPVKLVNSYSRNPQDAIMTLILAAQLSKSNSLDVTRGLFSLGASSAQGDMHQTTAFHYLVAARRVQLLKACLEEDGAAARTALNHLIVEDPQYRPKCITPLTTAIRSGDSDLVNALLDLGAKSVISLDDFAVAYTHANEKSTLHRIRRDDEDVSEIWQKHAAQPVLLAADNDMPDLIVKMLDAGADIDTLQTEASPNVFHYDDHKDQALKRRSLLDVVKAKIKKLETQVGKDLYLPEPLALKNDSEYLKDAAPASYEQWYLSKTIEVAKNVVEQWEDERIKQFEEEENRPGKQQRVEALKSLQRRFVDLKEWLVQKGGKTFKELHPELFDCKRVKNDVEESEDKSKEADNQEKAFDPKVTFRKPTTDRIREGYIRLFEAAWSGDVNEIKQLTLANWGPDKENTPLMVTVQDSKGFTPFVIALYKRHLDLARMILEIANAQFKGSDEDSPRRRYTIAEAGSDYSSDSDGDDLELHSQIVDETFTIDNIAALGQSVGSRVCVSDMLKNNVEVWCLLDLPEKDAHEKLGSRMPDLSNNLNSTDFLKNCLKQRGYASQALGRYVLVGHDLELLRFWLHCCQGASNMRSKDSTTSFSGFDTRDFEFCLRHGFVAELSEMIKIAGAELPLDALVKKSGIQEENKPKYYQGLSIGGKKMTNWARERGGSYERTMGESTPPLLQAAFQGGLTAMEWLLSDTPFRLYKEYGASNSNDHRLKMLDKANGGFDQATSSWLKQRSHLSLHASILSKEPESRSLAVLKYLLSIFPAAIEHPSASGSLTPLAVSFLDGRTEAASALIAAGADQTTRDITSKNLIHLALICMCNLPREEQPQRFRSLLSLVDSRLLPSLFTERCRNSPGSMTPLAFWLAAACEKMNSYWNSNLRAKLVPEILTIMLEYGGAQALTMMDGSGQFPLHQAVKCSYTGLVKLMLAHDPALLVRENAMGQTPLELAESLYVRDCVKGNPDTRGNGYRKLEDRKCEEFVEQENKGGEDFEDETKDVRATWRICHDCATRDPSPRKLVSVNEAREVARRLAERNKAKSEQLKGDEDEENGSGKNPTKTDEIDRWLGYRTLEMG